MELLADALSAGIGGQEADFEAALTLEGAYTLEATATERWRYGAAAWQKYTDALDRYGSAANDKWLENVVIRVADEIDYPLLQPANCRPNPPSTTASSVIGSIDY